MITEDLPVLLRPSTSVMGDESDLTLSISASLSKKPLRRLRDGVRQQGYYPSKLLLPLEVMSVLPSRGLSSLRQPCP
jgi:hypothetical protein